MSYFMSFQHVLITGGASGLGLGCARRFAALARAITICDINEVAGRRVVAELAREYPQVSWQFQAVDLASADSIAALCERLTAAGQAIDVLVNNAGVYPAAQRVLTDEGAELTFSIALLGHFRLTAGIWPLLVAAPAARVVTISSMVQRQARLDLDNLDLARGYMPIKAYQQSKLATLLFALELQRRLDAHPQLSIRSYAAHPGVCRSQLGRNRPRAATDGWWARLSYWALARGIARFGQTPEQAASTVIEAATTQRHPGGSYFGPGGLLEIAGKPRLSALGKAARSPELARGLWQRAEQLTGLSIPV